MIALYIDPSTHHFERDGLFRLEVGHNCGADLLAPWLHLREWMKARGVTVRTADALDGGPGEGDVNVYVSFGRRDRWRRLAGRSDVTPIAFVAVECPIVEPRLYRDLVDAEATFPHLYTCGTQASLQPFLSRRVELRQWDIPQSFDTVHEELWGNSRRKFLTMINANKVPRLATYELYTERLRALAVFADAGEVDLYGVGWEGPAFRVGESWVPGPLRRAGHRLRQVQVAVLPDPLWKKARSAWRGAVEDKAATLAEYRFALCFENMVLDGWVTEKLFDCLFSGTVPIYLGSPSVAEAVDPACFVDARLFDTYDQLRDHLHGLSPADVETMREAGRAYLGSHHFDRFRKETFARRMGGLVEEAAQVELSDTC